MFSIDRELCSYHYLLSISLFQCVILVDTFLRKPVPSTRINSPGAYNVKLATQRTPGGGFHCDPGPISGSGLDEGYPSRSPWTRYPPGRFALVFLQHDELVVVKRGKSGRFPGQENLRLLAESAILHSSILTSSELM